MGNYYFNDFRNSPDSNNKNLLTAMFASMMFLIFWSVFTSPSKEELEKRAKLQAKEKDAISYVKQQGGNKDDISSSIIYDMDGRNIGTQTRKQKNETFFENENSRVGIDVNNNRITYLSLKKYKQHEKDVKDVLLLDDGHFIEAGWVGRIGDDSIVDTSSINWKVDAKDDTSISISGIKNNVRYKTTYTIANDSSIEIKQQIYNKGKMKINVANYNRASLKNTKDRIENSNAFRGIVLMNDDKIKEFSYDKLEKENIESLTQNSGWIGLSDQYWLTALALPSTRDENYSTAYTARYNKNRDIYQIDVKSDMFEIESGGSLETNVVAIVAPKKLELLQNLGEKYKLQKLDKAIDFGIFYFLSKPLLIILKRLYSIVGNFGVAIILLTILVRMIILPLANRAYKTMARMKTITPQINELREKYKDDKKAFQMAMFQLYKDNDINPMSSVFPLLLQIPIFIALYKVLVISIELRDAPFVGWIVDLSSKDPSSIFNLFGLLTYSVPEILQIGLLPVIMGLTMFIQQKITPVHGIDETQRKVMTYFPLILTIMLSSMPAGLVLYWCCSNIFTIIQQSVILKIINRSVR